MEKHSHHKIARVVDVFGLLLVNLAVVEVALFVGDIRVSVAIIAALYYLDKDQIKFIRK